MNKELLEYFSDDELASNVFMSKYAAEEEKTPNEMHSRMAKEMAAEIKSRGSKGKKDLSKYGLYREELTEESIYNLFENFRYIIPQGSIMSGMGSNKPVSLSNCFVIDSAHDSYSGIMLTDQEQVQLMKRRGGVGHDLSNLRPSETKVNNSAGTSTGLVSFMERFSSTTREVAQSGRRGALMLSIDVRHPDVLDFTKVKSDLSKVTGANISIKLNKEFMEAIENDEDYVLRYPCDMELPEKKHLSCAFNELIKLNGGYIKRIKAKELWNEITKQARNNAEPGLMFWDNVLDYSPDSVYDSFRAISSNPCGEQFLQPYDSCRLICTNLFSFVNDPFTSKAKIDFKKLYEVHYEQQYIADLIVDIEITYVKRIIEKIKNDPEPTHVKQTELDLWYKILSAAQSGRRTGSGITALADMIAALGLKYDSEEALEITAKVMKTKMEAELDCSIDLAVQYGAFKGWDKGKEFTLIESNEFVGNNEFYNMLAEEFPAQVDRMWEYGRRNVSWSTIAPTGSVSILTQTSSGCEPVFMPFYKRRKKVNPSDKNTRVDFTDDNGDTWQEFFVIHEKFKEWAWSSQGIPSRKLDSEKYLEVLYKESPWYGSTANDIDWSKRLEMQEVLQKYTTNAISSTMNLPESTSMATVSEIYMKASKMGLKGVTVYREGSRSGVLVDSSKDKTSDFVENHSPKRPKTLPARVVRFQNNYDTWIAFVGLYKGRPYEVFTFQTDRSMRVPSDTVGQIVKTKENGKGNYDFIWEEEGNIKKIIGINSCVDRELYNYGKLFSGILRHGMPVLHVIETINNLNFTVDNINTWKNGVIRALKQFVENGSNAGSCPECTGKLVYVEGCATCQSCGASQCG